MNAKQLTLDRQEVAVLLRALHVYNEKTPNVHDLKVLNSLIDRARKLQRRLENPSKRWSGPEKL